MAQGLPDALLMTVSQSKQGRSSMSQQWELGRCGSALVLGKQEHGSLSSKLFCEIQEMESFFFFMCLNVFMCVCVLVHVEAAKGIRYPGAGVTGSCELSDVSVGT